MAETTEEIIIKVEAEGADKTTKELEQLADSLKSADKETEKYSKTLSDTAGEMQIFGTSINGLKGGLQSGIQVIKNSVTGLKAFKVALASTGIGLIVVALGSLAAWLTTTEEGTQLLRNAFTTISVIAREFTEILVKIFEGLRAIATGNFSEGISRIAKSFDGVATSISQAVTEAIRLDVALRALKTRAAGNSVALAQYNRSLSENKRISDDVTKSINTRIKANDKAIENLENINRVELELAKTNSKIQRDKLLALEDGTIAREEQLIVYAEAAAAEIDIETANIERSIELQNKGNSLRIERDQAVINRKKIIYGEDVKAVEKSEKEKLDAITAGAKEAARIQEDLNKQRRKAYAEDQAAQQEAVDTEIENVQAVATLYSTISNSLGLENKAAAIVDAIINTAVAISKVLGRPILMAAIAAAGAAQIATIAAQKIPDAKSYGRGGMLSGNSHASGGIHINAEGGEAIINKKSALMFRQELSAINVAGGGVPFMRLGGIVPTAGATTSPFIDLEQTIAANRSVLVTEDLNSVQQSLAITEAITTL